MPKKTIKKSHHRKKLHLLAKFHAVFTLAAFVTYVSLGALFGPELLMKDLSDRYAKAASITVGLRVMGPPETPLVSAYSECDSWGTLSVGLSWLLLEDTTSYELYRNGEVLITGITGNTYIDYNVEDESSYSYYIVAIGPLGVAQSDTITVNTVLCEPAPLPDPSVTVVTLDTVDLTQQGAVAETTDTTPLITGTTNMPNANISIVLNPGSQVVASTVANGNGYWFWQVPQTLTVGQYSIFITATDPLDLQRTESVTLSFAVKEIPQPPGEEPQQPVTNPEPQPPIAQQPVAAIDPEVKDDSDDEDHDKRKETGDTATGTSAPQASPLPGENISEQPEREDPIEVAPQKTNKLTLQVANSNRVVLRAQKLHLRVLLNKANEQWLRDNGEVSLIIYDEKGGKLFEEMENVFFEKGSFTDRQLQLPISMGPGQYKISAQFKTDSTIVVGEDYFAVKDLPFTTVAGGVLLEHENLISNIGTVALWSLAILVMFTFLIWLEYGLSLHASRYVYDGDLNRSGLLTRRKEVKR